MLIYRSRVKHIHVSIYLSCHFVLASMCWYGLSPTTIIHHTHYNDVIMTTIASQITSLMAVYSTVYSDANQRKHQSSASLAFVWGIHRDRWIPRTKGQLRGKCFHLMTSSCIPSQRSITGALYYHRLTLEWVSNYINYKVRDKIAYPFPNCNSAAGWEWISNSIPYFTGHGKQRPSRFRYCNVMAADGLAMREHITCHHVRAHTDSYGLLSIFSNNATVVIYSCCPLSVTWCQFLIGRNRLMSWCWIFLSPLMLCHVVGFLGRSNSAVSLGTPVCGSLTLQWRHNGRDSVSNHQPQDCLLSRLFRRRSKKTSKLHVIGLCAGNSPGLVNSSHKWPVTRKKFPFDDVIMYFLSKLTQCVVVDGHKSSNGFHRGPFQSHCSSW